MWSLFTHLFLPPAYEVWGKVMFWNVSVCLSVHTGRELGRGYLPWIKWEGVLTLNGGGGTYLGCRQGVPTLNRVGKEYLPWMGQGVPLSDGRAVPTLDRGRGIHIGWGKTVPTLDGGRGYLPWMGEGYVPWMGVGRGTYLGWGRGTYLGWGEGYLPWTGGGGTCLGQVMPRAVRLFQFPVGGLSCNTCFCK